MTTKKGKGIGLLSGGLDSILAVKVLQEQDLDLVGIIFKTPFFGPKPGMKVESVMGIPILVIDIGETHLRMLKKPIYGYGSQMNPCIDCHALMLKEAGKIMEQEEGDFLFTGEVLGQRPMSQRRDALRSVEKLSGYPGRVLRPLSARLLPPTIVEIEGAVDRDRLLDIHGRSRRRQLDLAEHYGIKDIPQPGGGCMLTKEGFVRKLRELFHLRPDPTPREVEILKWGRHFLLPDGNLCVVGRHQKDNEKLEQLAESEEYQLRVIEHPGPTALLLTPLRGEDDLRVAARILVAYSDTPAGASATVEWRHAGVAGKHVETNLGRAHFEELLI